MVENAIDDDWEVASSTKVASTLVLVGKTGNGKSATGNSILGWEAFKSDTSFFGVTSVCKMESTILKGGQKPNVTDTPGLFAPSKGIDFIGKEIVRCIDLARDGIHAILIVCSIRNRFAREEQYTIQALQDLFGDKIANYIILIFTGGDDFPDKDDPLANYLGPNCPKAYELCRG